MRNKMTQEMAVCGYNAAAALAEFHPERVNRLFLREDRLKDFSKVCKLLAGQKKAYKICEDEELERLCKSPRHQGVVAIIDEPEIAPLDLPDLDAWAKDGATVLVLDSVGNDNNLGAIVRSAAFFGVAAVVLSQTDEEARLTTSAYRVAEGGMEHVVFRSVRDVGAFLEDASRRLAVIGADHRARLRLRDLPGIIPDLRAELAGRGLLIVIGNEEHGLSAKVKKACTALVRVPGTGNIESLNVAQAATLFLYQLYEV
jgi:TrmH RNA methyltransferase